MSDENPTPADAPSPAAIERAGRILAGILTRLAERDAAEREALPLAS